jgi:hypothetical protein
MSSAIDFENISAKMALTRSIQSVLLPRNPDPAPPGTPIEAFGE